MEKHLKTKQNLIQIGSSVHLGLKDSCNCLMMFCCNSEPPHVRVNVNCLQERFASVFIQRETLLFVGDLLETGCSFFGVVLLVAVGCVHVVGCGVVLVSKLKII